MIISCGHVLGQGALGIIMLSLKAGSAHRDSSGPGASEVGAGGGVEGVGGLGGGVMHFVHLRFIITSPSRLSVGPLGHRQCLVLKKTLILNQKVNFEQKVIHACG